jgi:hypothetical protein
MRPPWLTAQESDDTDMLQTDVMRFMAILGLCLTAIFSMVQSASMETNQTTDTRPMKAEQPAREQRTRLPVPQQTPDRTVKPSASKTITATVAPKQIPQDRQQTPAHAATSSATDAGFSLSFVSATAMNTLLQTGAVKLYAHIDNGYWQLLDGGFVAAPAPGSYYEMHASTVPHHLAALLDAITGNPAKSWGVTLPEHTMRDVEGILSEQRSGDLIINANGSVSSSAQ